MVLVGCSNPLREDARYAKDHHIPFEQFWYERQCPAVEFLVLTRMIQMYWDWLCGVATCPAGIHDVLCCRVAASGNGTDWSPTVIMNPTVRVKQQKTAEADPPMIYPNLTTF